MRRLPAHPAAARVCRVMFALLASLALGSAESAASTPTRAELPQGITTAAVRGTVRSPDGGALDGVTIEVRNVSTGYLVRTTTHRGRFLLQGLEVGGPYTLTVRRIGLRPVARELGRLTLGEPVEVALVVEPVPVVLAEVETRVAPGFPAENVHGGTATRIADSVLRRLPSLNRDLYDFVRLVPQISTRVGQGLGGISGGGANFRLNQFLTNGVPERSLAGGQPPEFGGGRTLPLGAVAEYQVLLAPFDVRYGDFAGAAVNAVTRTGTNRLEGSAFAQMRSDALARDDPALAAYSRAMFGGAVAGPLVRDRAHYVVAAEFQRLESPMTGPHLGGPGVTGAPVTAADVARLDAILRTYGLRAGSGAAVTNRNPLANLFARIDGELPGGLGRGVIWVSEADSRSLAFSRGARDSTFALSSQVSSFAIRARTVAFQAHTALARAGGGHNEFFLSRRGTRAGDVPAVRQPIVSVAVPSASGAGVSTILTGTPPQSQGSGAHYRSVDLRDNLTLPLGASHVATLGVEAQWFRLDPGSVSNGYGSWSFRSLDSLAAGVAERFEVTRDLGGGSAPLTGAQYAVHAGDRWRATDRLTVTLGVRADLLALDLAPPYVARVDSVFGRRTDQRVAARAQFSPRVGLTWVPGDGARDRLRAGVGVFTGRPPLAWFHTPLRTYGTGTGAVRCGPGPADQGPAPAFVPDPRASPTACAGSTATLPFGDVELVAPGLRMARALRGVLAWDRRLGPDLLLVTEALITRGLTDFVFVNRNLVGPQGADARGRVRYGTIDATGRAAPALHDASFPSVIELQEVASNRATQLSARLEKRFVAGSAAMASYTWTRARDVQTPLRVNNRGLVNWSSRALSGRHEDPRAGISQNDVPHRVVLAGSWRAPWWRGTTEVALLYVGESGSPFTYRAWGSRGLGDLNADGSAVNDPIYVPADASSVDEIAFSGLSDAAGADNSPGAQATRIAAQQEAFGRFIDGSDCLRRARGSILARNACREPWSHTSVVTVRQRLPAAADGFELQLDVFNPLNLVRASWGVRRVAAPAVLEHVGQTVDGSGASVPLFRFERPAARWTVVPAESSYQVQLGLFYRF